VNDPTVLPSGQQKTIRGKLLGVIDLAGRPESVSLARKYVRGKLGGDHPALDDVTLLVSEIVTNSLIHSDSRDGGTVTLAIADCFDRIHVDVVDAGGQSIPRVYSDIFAEGGRGLLLVDAISLKWGVYQDDAGRAVWFEVRYKRARVPSRPRQREPGEPADIPQSAVVLCHGVVLEDEAPELG
jgi:anti-sigma regulatory factor (Ser/Thr protein kinase)